jgi:putative hydrolase of HD superfamily
MIPRGFVDRLYATATVQRWTDHVRPLDMTALGKHAHMLVIAWVIGRRAEQTEGWDVDWDYLIRGSLYELLRISVLTDIKAPLLEEIRSNDEDRQNLDAYVVKRLTKALKGCPPGLLDDLATYYADDHGPANRWNAHRILMASSALATSWEFRLIEQANPLLHDIAETRRNIEASARQHQYVPAVLDIYENRNDLSCFTDLCGRLRFQLRWSQTPILPPRPVLDHELLVAYLSYACTLDTPSGDERKDYWRRYHACFGALFHDLPEVLTRDVIYPVKHGAKIEGILQRIERSQFEKTIAPLLPEDLYRELSFFALEEFKDKNWPATGWPEPLTPQDEGRAKTKHPGRIIEACDKFAAFMEAYYSISYGIRSDDLMGAVFPKDARAAKRRQNMNKAYPFGGLYDAYTTELATKHGIQGP